MRLEVVLLRAEHVQAAQDAGVEEDGQAAAGGSRRARPVRHHQVFRGRGACARVRVPRLHEARRRPVHCPALPRAAGPAPHLRQGVLLQRRRQPPPRRRPLQHPHVHCDRDQPRGRRPLQVRGLRDAQERLLLHAAGRLQRQLPHRRRRQRLHARLAQLPDRAPLVAAALDALLPKGGARAQADLRQARRALRAGERLPPP
mmetsp:Transcript_19297/g.37535  ORF Transcript_19297/g.37535 Transcript_19297/m.37535 type:complete len:201 (-) Transcript_19297:682-1284(-)